MRVLIVEDEKRLAQALGQIMEDIPVPMENLR